MKASVTTLALWFAFACFGNAQSTSTDQKPADQTTPAPAAAQPAPAAAAPAAPAAPAPLSSPAMTGPLSNLPPLVFDAGPFKNLSMNAVLSGMGVVQSAHISGDESGTGSLTNGQIILQKADGLLQFYVQAGAYQIPSLATSFISTGTSVNDLFGPVPLGYFKLNGKTTSLEIGSLPTLIGAEYTFSFENMNIERGLLWNQEPAISKGLQLNQTLGKWTLAVSWNDGFYSNRYTWFSGSIAYAKGAHALSFVAGGNYGQTVASTYASPVQNNSSLYNIIYTYTKGTWVFTPYVQYTDVPTNNAIGVSSGAHTFSGAAMASKTFSKGFSMAARFEDIASSGSASQGSVNLLFGPGSEAYSLTFTPTYQKGGFFARGDISWVHANDITEGDAFGGSGKDRNQTRAMLEMGFIFGDNIVKK